MVRAWRSVRTRVTPMARWRRGVPIALSGLLKFGPRSERVGGGWEYGACGGTWWLR